MPNQPPDKPKVLRETDDAARALAQQLLLSAGHAAFATLEPDTQWPLASRVSLALDAGVPLILISRLSAHYAAVESDARCALLLGEPVGSDGDPLRHARMTLLTLAHKVPPPQRAHVREVFVARHPDAAVYADFADFDFFHLRPQRANLNAGFGRAYALSSKDLSVIMEAKPF